MWLEQFLIYTTTFLVLCLTILYLHFKKSYKYWSNNHIEYIKPIFPFGNIKDLFFKKKSFGDILANVYKHFKSRKLQYGGMFVLQKPVLFVVDPELIKCILTKDFGSFHDRGVYMDEENDPLSASLLGLPGLRWKTLRAKLTPTFTSGKMKMMFHTVVACTKELDTLLDEHISKQKAIDVKDVFSRLTTDIIGSVAFGLDCNSLKNPDSEFLTYGKRVFQFHFRDIFLNFLADNYPYLLHYFKIAVTPPEVTTFFTNIVKQTVEYRETNNIHRKDFLDLLIRLKNKENITDDVDLVGTENEDGISIENIAAESFVFFAGGFETSSTTVNFCLYELACHQDIQDKLRKEIVKALNNNAEELTYEALMNMTYLEMVIQETLRKYPPIPLLQRECNNDYEIPGHNFTVKKGTQILLSTLGIHRDPEFYPDPETFNPERFSPEEKAKRNSFTYLPFGEGPRICIGKRFAFLQVKIILATVLKQYKFTLDPRSVGTVGFDPQSLFLLPEKPFYLRLTKIEN